MTELNSESEQKRIASLKSFQILDTLPEKEFDELTLLASQICETPLAAISLIDENRQWFKSSIGFPGTETPRDLSFCHYTIQSDDLLVIPDTTKNKLFAENPAVKNAPKIRFYAGAPLRTSDGQRLGTLSVTDLRPRELSEEQKNALNALSNSVISLLESRRALVSLKKEMTDTMTFPTDENFFVSDDTVKKFLGKWAINNSSVFHRHVKRYLIATLLIVIITAAKIALASYIQVESPFLLFACAVLLAAWRGGLGPGIYATWLTVCIIDFYFLSPAGKVFDRSYSQNIQLLVFIAQGLFITLLCASRLRGENLLNYARNQLENRVSKRTNQLAQANKVLHKEIQERGVLQKDLQKARDAALEAARLKSDFLANMSHEIRTPMNGVIGVTGLLLETKLDGEQQRYAETIRNSGESLLIVINDILDFSKVEAGKFELETIDFNLQNTIESTVELLTSKARAQKNELATLIYNDVPLNLRGDVGRIQQILTNLIGNAVKFTKSGDIVVRVKNVEETAERVKLKFSVADTGEGISKEVQEKLFQPFTQSDASMSRRFGGTGLGLSISKKLIEMMDGEIGVESEPGKGSTFWFNVLLEKQHSSSPSNSAGTKFPVAHEALAGQRVLVVDDNTVNREVLVYQIRSWSMETDEATNGFESIGLVKSASSIGKPFDLIVLDLHLPGINGLETARRITSEIKGKPPAMILLSSGTNKTDAKTLRKAGISGSLNRPYRQSDLLDAVYETLGLNRRAQNPVFSVHTTTAPVPENDLKTEFEITEDVIQTGKSKRIL
ncbi:MAG: ATP-binding protein, partial [Acidobacteriota bacterium]|nr:ATP-binding protein [Acidobacteriota bacterium]